ncbi:hypothetical protein EVAR_55221_1 [Eumeta japonica]|uniref:Uncharacterized protein n=1 Tax=Eumeta variegata TaxID=151549 RepID=A0A4C1ZKY5_EUMVA|nr:hypothetical protein EVAR_55221_1 [Eumeta japonica]
MGGPQRGARRAGRALRSRYRRSGGRRTRAIDAVSSAAYVTGPGRSSSCAPGLQKVVKLTAPGGDAPRCPTDVPMVNSLTTKMKLSTRNSPADWALTT